MKSLVDLLEHLLLDCGRRSGAHVLRDVKTLRSRSKHEGDGFITITLPAFCRDFERCLDYGRIAPGLFSSFRKTRAGIPAFLQGFLCNVFGPGGVLLPNPSIDCIRAVRQICLFGKKICRPCSKERERKAIKGYLECEDSIRPIHGQLWRYYKKVASIISGSLHLSQPAILAALKPSHGPGATREHISGNQKWVFRRWHLRLTEVGFEYPIYGRSGPVLGSNFSWEAMDALLQVEYVTPWDEEPSRVVFVPKTQKTPRVIAVEPVCMQYAQQGLGDILEEQLDNCSYTAGLINFKDQTVNQVLARTGSKDGSLATIDMSEASDRVSVEHVRWMFAESQDFLRWLFASRSLRSELPNGDIVTLKKFASMGSALCFPVEALVFFTSIVASRILRAGLFPSEQTVYSFGRDVHVYGDDLIVPAGEAPAICDDLEALGFKVNRHKSFWIGKFRESCGSDCYDNEEVTPVYLRRDLPTSRRDVEGILSCLSTCNQLYQAGYTGTAAVVRDAVERVVGKLPQTLHDSPAIGWLFHSEVEPPERWNQDLQRREKRMLVPVSSRASDPLDGDPALRKCLTSLGIKTPYGTRTFRLEHSALARCFESIGLKTVDPDHLSTSPRPYSLTLKRRWVSR